MRNRASIVQYITAVREFQYLKETNQPVSASALCKKYRLNRCFSSFMNTIGIGEKVTDEQISQWREEYLQKKKEYNKTYFAKPKAEEPKSNELIDLLRDIYDELVSIHKELR